MIRTIHDRSQIPDEGRELWPLNAMRDRGVTLEAIMRDQNVVAFSNGIVLPVLALYDRDGFRVDEWEDACTYEFGNSHIGYGRASCAGDAVSFQ